MNKLVPTALALKAYRALVQSGLLDNRVIKSTFLHTYFAYKRFFEDPYFNLSKRYRALFEGGHVLDVGANVGYTSAIFARAITGDYKVYAFEPEQKNFAQLLLTIENSNLADKIIPIAKAVGERDARLELWLNPFHPGDHRILTPAFRQILGDCQGCSVDVLSIDSFVSKEIGKQVPISFIKIDVQGYEQSVCEGMTETLASQRTTNVSFEFSPETLTELGFEPQALLDFFSTRGFYLFLIGQNGTLEQWNNSEQQQRLLSRRSYVELLASREMLI